jgi:Arc/MetJ-type ribon-helix-helix transcriptional regulator
MKLSQLKRLILETLEEEVEPQYEVYNEVGNIYQVLRPTVGMTKEDMVCEVTVFDDIDENKTHGVYKNRSEANRTANELLKNYESQITELETEMENYRTTKKEVAEKAKLAKERIAKLKGETPLDKKKK